ncbi:MAG TPA: ACT domain-containing protein [Dehalococcoidales bacterium]|nr:ACT domain-containing protein [Dehalococcoidales bacterium]
MRAVITVIGKDRVGIIAGVSTTLAESNTNILDISQTTLQEYFAMIMLVDLSQSTASFHQISKQLEGKGRELGMQINIQREDIFNAMHEI